MKALSTFVLLFSISNLLSQQISCGEISSNGFGEIYNPNLVLELEDLPNGDMDSLTLDLNNNQIEDFKIRLIHNDGGFWFDYKWIEIIPLNGGEIAMEGIESCFANNNNDIVLSEVLAKSFSELDVVSENSTWIDSNAMLCYHKHNASIPDNLGYTCINGDFNLASNFIGIRFPHNNDWVYGWIQVKEVQTIPTKLILEAYGINGQNLASTSTLENDNLKIFLDDQNITILSGREIEEVKFVDLSGRIIVSSKPYSKHLTVDVSGINTNILFIELKHSNKQSIRRKIFLH